MGDTSSKGQMKAHEGTYASFIGLFKYGTVACALVAALVVYLISR